MGKAVFLSGALHVATILILVIGLPSFVSLPEVAPPIPVELVELEDEPSKPVPKPKPKPEPEKQPEPEPEPQQAEVAPAPKPEPVAPEPEPEPEQVPLPPEPEAKPKPETKPELEKELAEAPPKPSRKPKLKMPAPDQPEKPEENRLTSILRNVEKLKKQQAARPEEDPKANEAAPRVQASRFEVMELARAIQQQMAACWRIEPGARDAHDLVVQVYVRLNRDGSVLVANIVDNSRMATDAFYRSAAENARRAILSCQPFELPPKRYEVWREMTLNFNPGEMFGG